MPRDLPLSLAAATSRAPAPLFKGRDLLHSPRTPHLLRLWQDVRALDALPQMDRWLAQRFRSEKGFGQKDRRWYAEAIFLGLRFGLWAAASDAMEGEGWTEVPDSWRRLDSDAAWQLVKQLPSERLFLWLSRRLDPDFAPGEGSQGLWPKSGDDEAAAWLWQGLPPSFAVHAAQRVARGSWSPEDAAAFVAQQGSRPPLWIRLNHPEQAAAVKAELIEKGWLLAESGAAIALHAAAKVSGLSSFMKGLFEVQDFASQRIGGALPLEGEPWVWDVCAGGGGKTLQIAARLQGRGRLFASDVRAYKLDELSKRIQRARFKAVSCLPWDGHRAPDFPPALRQRGGFDCVLIDAPCTGAGTWRRNPDARFRLSERQQNEYTVIQDQVLSRAAPFVKRGGSLVYATCSWLVAENEERIEKFLKRFPEFSCREQLLIGGPSEDADTMFVATLVRT